MNTASTVLVLSSVVAVCLGQFQWPCPIGCALSTCGTFGCSACRSGYYVYMSKGFAGCVRDCPKGTYANAVDWCSGCAAAGCTECSSKYTCTECSEGYELQANTCVEKVKY